MQTNKQINKQEKPKKEKGKYKNNKSVRLPQPLKLEKTTMMICKKRPKKEIRKLSI